MKNKNYEKMVNKMSPGHREKYKLELRFSGSFPFENRDEKI
jgi:hypothetical protein